ncbi:hypothetical protein Q4E93_20595 [Flavitalea sp. BT771]|uniref:hypothetical protein n=1 Tax=Flavitalea sp. BT771 TaxID=3063329 RepID=UPI0026E3D2A1|nr:hypothetical protein [Flavitalea sp. BT771]MDO6433019.1 hypothetical protein [Flavitalea sp. BT771]MDV6221705.1 hypothetical protein [Flavitalea sp. BT771]
MKFKCHFPAGYTATNISNDNIDINVVTEDENVYFATLFTLENIHSLMAKDESPYFWATNMLIVKDLSLYSIRSAIDRIVNDGYLESAACKIGDTQKVFGETYTFDSLPDK